MMKSLDSSAMENNSILQQIAGFDIEAPVKTTICFEEEFDDIPVKTEIETVDSQHNTPKIDNSAFVPILEPKKEIQEETFAPDLSEERNKHVDNDTQDVTAHVKNLQDTVPKSDISKKRKTENLQDLDQIKRGRKNELDTENRNNCDKENSSHNFNHVNDKNDDQNLPNIFTSEITNSTTTTSVDPALVNAESTASLSDRTVDVNGLQQSEIDKINAYITKSLGKVSENMRRILNAYGSHKLLQTSPESFRDIKYNYFDLSYQTIVTMLLPEEKNYEFIKNFINDTFQRARKLAGPYYNRTCEEYTNLLYEMFHWAKQKQMFQVAQNKANFLKPVNPASSETELNKHPEQETGNNNLAVNSINTKGDKVCIFSSGPPGMEFSINVDPVLSKYFETPAQNSVIQSKAVHPSPVTSENEIQKSKNNNNTAHFKTTTEYLTKFAAKYRNNNTKTTNPPAILPTVSRESNVTTATLLQQQPESLSNNSSCLMTNTSNYNIPTQQMSVPTPVLRMRLNMPPICGPTPNLQQQQSQRPPPSQYGTYGNPRNFQAKANKAQPIFQYDQSQHFQTPTFQQQQIPTLYSQTHLRQPQQSPAQSGSSQQFPFPLGQTQQMPPQHSGSMHVQSQLGQSQQPTHQYKHTKQAQVRLLQQYRHQPQLPTQEQQSRSTEHRPTMASLPNVESNHSPLLPSFPQHDQSQPVERQKIDSWQNVYKSQSEQWKSRNAQPQQIQQQTVWHQEFNARFYQVQAQQTQKGSPRSASTDSGFISPLNFNVSAEQTIPTVPPEPESTIPVITHVTSLNDKVSFVDLGNCIVCKKSTKQMCMGCMKVYYCTYQCQSQDWVTHASYCTQQTTNQSGAQNQNSF